MKADLRLYLATDSAYCAGEDIVSVVACCIARGVTAVQLRDKQASSAELYELGKRLLAVTRPLGVPLIVNDRVDIMLALGADGVHVGKKDLPLPEARRLAPGAILGYTAKTAADIRHAEQHGADYVGIGPVFSTSTKPCAGPVLGPAGVGKLAAQSDIPSVGIGGIDERNVTQLADAGLSGVCVISGILDQPDPAEAASLIRWLLEGE
mgnify:CR=1 FL=1